MVISELLTQLEDIHPHQFQENTAILLTWIRELETDIAHYINTNYTNADADLTAYASTLTTEDETLIDEPSLYIEYLAHKIDFSNGEFERSNNHAALFNSLMDAWKTRYFRNNKDSINMPRRIRGL